MDNPALSMPDDASESGLALQVPKAKPQAPPSPTQPTRRPTLWSAVKPDGVSGLMVEPELAPAYYAYSQSRSPESADALIKQIGPILDEATRSYAGSEGNTVTTRARAKRLALEAIRRYDPARAKLRTHLLSHLRGLRRMTERSTAGIYVPEQWRLDSHRVDAMTRDARDELGREPSDAEVSDRLGIPIDRVRKAKQVPGVLAASQFEGSTAAHTTDQKAWNMWVESVYHDLHPTDQVILENSFGLHGRPVMAANKIAQMVNLSPGAVSQRKSKIQQQLDEYETFMGRS